MEFTMKPVSGSPEELGRIKALYQEAFPPIERLYFPLLMKKADGVHAEQWSFFEDDTWVGWAYVIRGGDLAYLFFFAMDSARRGRGCGHRALSLLREHYSRCRFFLAMETPDPRAKNQEQRLRRKRFYESCGLTRLPWHILETVMCYSMMGTPCAMDPREYRAMFRGYLGPFLTWLMRMRIVPDPE